MTALVCPHCLSLATFTVVHRISGTAPGEEGATSNGAIQCQNEDCRRVLGGFVNGHDGKGIIDWWPKHVGGKDFPDVPEHIGSTADEAHKCMSIGAHRGAIALARSVVEATAKHHKIEKGMLDKKIEQMAAKGIISSAMRQAADEIRFAGNEVAHGDLAEQPITAEDARDVLELMDAILTRVYQEPKQVERVRARRKERLGESDEVPV